MEFSWQEYWSGLPCPPPRDLPNLGIRLKVSLYLLHRQAGSLPLVTTGKPFPAYIYFTAKTVTKTSLTALLPQKKKKIVIIKEGISKTN